MAANPMAAVTEELGKTELPEGSFLAGYEDFERAREGREPEGVAKLRRRGIERFAELGFPSMRQEEWRFTNVAPIAKGDFHRVGPDAESGSEPGSEAGAPKELIEPWLVASAGTHLVFVDGRLAPEHSDLAGLPPGTVLSGLGSALLEHPERVEAHLARHASFEAHPFVALNTGYMAEGAFLHVPPGALVAEPIHVLYYSTGTPDARGRPPVAYPRNLMVLGEAAQATLVETYAGPEGALYFNCPVTEIVCGPSAVLDHYKMQQESTGAFHMATFQLHQERGSSYALHSISLGGALVRNDVNTRLDGPGCESILNGLYMVRGRQFVDHHMKVEHAAPHCHSFELFKGILDERSRGVFNGLIHVHPGAQKTDAKQSNQNLLLSDQALVNSHPQLLIFADDVRCTHGSTVGQLDEDAIFYLRSRGIGEEAAKSLLVYAFASDIVGRIKVPELRRDLEEFLFTRLPKGEVVRQAV
jgi:Fe-S cluster assembly protein SufD